MMKICIVKKCDHYPRKGFRKCSLCVRGLTPDVRKVVGEKMKCKYCEEPMQQKPQYLNVCPDGVMCVGEEE